MIRSAGVDGEPRTSVISSTECPTINRVSGLSASFPGRAADCSGRYGFGIFDGSSPSIWLALPASPSRGREGGRPVRAGLPLGLEPEPPPPHGDFPFPFPLPVPLFLPP